MAPIGIYPEIPTKPLLCVDMPRHEMTALRDQAMSEGRTMSSLVCQLVREYLKAAGRL